MEKIKEIIGKYEYKRQALIPCLHYIHSKYGYAGKEAIAYLAKELNVPSEDVYSVLSFYTLFYHKPQGKYIIRVCDSPACYLAGSTNVLESLKEILGIDVGEVTPDGKFSIEKVSCLGLCDKAPAMMVNDVEYTNLTHEKIKEIIENYREGETI